MKLPGPGKPPAGSARVFAPTAEGAFSGPLGPLLRFVGNARGIGESEARKLRSDPTELLTRAIQPALWLLVFGQVFARTRAIPTGGMAYLDFMAPGILAQSVLFIAIFYGIGVIWERDLGILHKFLASPAPRSALVLGKGLSAGLRALSQAIIIYVLALVLGVHVDWNPFKLLGVAAVVILGASLFATFSLVVACLVKTRERFMGIGQILTMPLFFASNAIYPISIMPPWLRAVAGANPLSYMVDALRALMISGAASASGLGVDIAVLGGATAILVAVGALLYPTIAY